MYFSDVALHLNNLNPHHPKMLCSKFGWNWLSDSGEEYENVKSVQTGKQTDGQTTDATRPEKFAQVS